MIFITSISSRYILPKIYRANDYQSEYNILLILFYKLYCVLYSIPFPLVFKFYNLSDGTPQKSHLLIGNKSCGKHLKSHGEKVLWVIYLIETFHSLSSYTE